MQSWIKCCFKKRKNKQKSNLTSYFLNVFYHKPCMASYTERGLIKQQIGLISDMCWHRTLMWLRWGVYIPWFLYAALSALQNGTPRQWLFKLLCVATWGQVSQLNISVCKHSCSSYNHNLVMFYNFTELLSWEKFCSYFIKKF